MKIPKSARKQKRIEHMPGHVQEDPDRWVLHSSSFSKRPLAIRRLARRAKRRRTGR